MWKKIAIIVSILLAVVVVVAFAVPTFAADSGTAQPTQVAQQTCRPRILARLLLIQDETKVDALIAKAKENGKITEDQALKIKQFWTDHHKQFLKNTVLTRLIWANDGAKVQAFLDKAVAAGKITPEQAGKLMDFWNAVHK